MVSTRSLSEKLNDPGYMASLSERYRKELLFSATILSEDELRNCSSISVAYSVARITYIREHLKDEDLAERVRTERIPIYGIFERVKEL